MRARNGVPVKILTADQCREMDRHTIDEVGVPSLELMERAGAAMAREALARFSRAKRVAVICGPGNNGGDGWVIARHLSRAGVDVTVHGLAPRGECTADCARMWARIPDSVHQRIVEDFQVFDLIVDAIFGTGFTSVRSADKPSVQVIRAISRSGRPVLAIDVASGLDATTGKTGTECVQATLTMTVQNPKVGMFIHSGPKATGDLEVVDIGLIQPAPWEGAPEYMLPADFRPPPVDPEFHKRDRGSVLCVGGSTGMPGSIAMTAYAALRAGAGLVTCAVPESIQPVVATFHPEVMTIPLPDSGMGCLTPEATERVLSILPKYEVLAVGPGLTTQPPVREAVQRLVQNAEKPLVLDADGLNCLAEVGPVSRKAAMLLTPHPGEAARLSGVDTAKVQADRWAAAEKLGMDYGSTVVLKGRHTATYEVGQPLRVNGTGNSGMATAGSGDVLTGVIAAFACGMSLYEAGYLAALLHGAAGDICLDEIGFGFTAMDIAWALPDARRRLA